MASNQSTNAKRIFRSISLITIGIALASIGLECFLIPNGFLDGGVTGISLLINKLTHISFPLLLFVFNIPFILIGYRNIGKTFALSSIVSIGVLALVLEFIHFPVLTQDELLVACFGGVFLGAGIGFAVRGGAVLDGTEILAIFISRKSPLSIGDIILIFNIFIFAAAALLISVEIAMYAMLTYYIAAKAVTFIIEGIEEYISVMVVSDKADEIRYDIVHNLGYGVTILDGKRGGYGRQVGEALQGTQVVFTVVTRLELPKLQSTIKDIDPSAFIVLNSLMDTKGGMVKRRMTLH